MTENEIHALLVDVTWLRALARRLARDVHLADDVVQEACTIALQQTPPPRQWRQWLVGVVKTLLLSQRRDRARQYRHERAARRTAAAEHAEGVVQRGDLQQRLVAAVMQLDEPYRTTVLLRFFDDLPPRQIADRQGVPVATVHSRLQRALQQLRARLDRDAGGRQRWLALVAPFAWPKRAGRPLRASAPVRHAWFGIAAVAVLVPVATGIWLLSRSAPLPAAVDRTAVAPEVAPLPVANETSPAPERLTVAPPAEPAAPTYRVDGRLIDCRGTGITDVAITAVLGDDKEKVTAADVRPGFARTTAGGYFTGELPGTAAFLLPEDPRYEPVLVGNWSHGAPVAPVLVVAPKLRVAGRVTTTTGQPLRQGRIALELPPGLLADASERLDRSIERSWKTGVAEDGAFEFARLPQVEGAVLVVAGSGLEPVRVALPPASTEDLQIMLSPMAPRADELRGRVLTADGAPAAGARVAMGLACVEADREGQFAISLLRAGGPQPLLAVAPDTLPARCDVPANGGAAVRDWPDPLILQLGAVAGSVRGRVVRASGVPVAGAEVWLDDPQPFGVLGKHQLQIEYLIARAPLWSSSSRPMPATAAAGEGPAVLTGRWVHEQEPTAAWQFATTDGDGWFSLSGLLPRAYRLRAFDPGTGSFAQADGVTAGSEPQLVVADQVIASLPGHVLTLGGAPVAGACVRQQFRLFEHKGTVATGPFEFVTLRHGRTATTAADGSFELRSVSLASSFFVVEGDRVMPSQQQVEGVGTGRAIVIRVEQSCSLEVALADPDEADSVACEDAEGRALGLSKVRGTSSQLVTSVPLHAGRSGPFLVSERAAHCVLRRDGVGGRRIAIRPDPTQTTLVQ